MGPITDTQRITYEENVKLAIQEKRGVFDSAFEFTSSVKGKQVQVVDIIGKSEARVDAPEGGDTPNIDAGHEPVWMQPHRLDWGKILRKEDTIKSLTDFKSQYVQGGAAGIVRGRNAILAAAIFGPRLIGNEIPVSTVWAGSTVPVDFGTTGTPNKMSVKKILNGLRLMEEADVILDEVDLQLAMDPEEQESLWNDITFVSKDYRDKAQLDDKNRRAMAIFGIPIIPTRRIADSTAGTVSTTALFAKQGMYWGEAMPLTTDIQPNPAKQYRLHPYLEEWIAATRTEDALAVKILNKIG